VADFILKEAEQLPAEDLPRFMWLLTQDLRSAIFKALKQYVVVKGEQR
jgi:hypothetical protein